MNEKNSGLVIQTEIAVTTAQPLHEVALDKGLRAAAIAVTSLTEVSDMSFRVAGQTGAESDPESIIRAERHQLRTYAQSIGVDLPTMSRVWNTMVSEAFENPENCHFQFQNIPVRPTRYPSETNSIVPVADDATGLNVTRLFGWVTEMQLEIQEREAQMTKSAFVQFMARSSGSLGKFKLLANFAYSQMGQEVPYDPQTFSMTGRKEKDLAIEQTAERLQAGYVANLEHPLIEQVEISVGIDRQLKTVPGISVDNMGIIITQHKQDLGITDVNRSLCAAFTHYDSLSGHAKTRSAGISAYSIEGLVSSLQYSTVRSKEILCTVLNDVLIEDSAKKDVPLTSSND